jgi:hypothetical protein
MQTEAPTFAQRLMAEVLRLHQIPKVQVERIVGPILGIFLPQVLGDLLKIPGTSTGFEVIAPEFPLKRDDNHQSTNIDWLALHRPSGTVLLLELKTAVDSVDRAQLETYERIRRRIEGAGAGFLLDDLRVIHGASTHSAKYDTLLGMCEPFEAPLRAARRALTVCLLPAACRTPDTMAPVLWRNFGDLPARVSGELAEAWSVVREGLVQLDAPRSTAARPVLSPSVPAATFATPTSHDEAAKTFALHILSNLRRERERRSPQRFWIGATGSGASPNYQVAFSDGTIQTYHHSGAHHRVNPFTPSKLRGPFPFPT